MASTNDVYWIIKELIDGHSLDQVLQDEGPLSEREVIKVIFSRILLQSCSTYVHTNISAHTQATAHNIMY